MCGIAGFVGEGGEGDLKSMIGAIRYRGPDDQGIFLNQNVGLAHARLSIIDTSRAGHQPMTTDDGSVHIVFNGEIYNFAELRKILHKTSKYTFVSNSDTEVILYLYKEYGEKLFEKLNGMFAIAIYDHRSDKLILARDRLGQKPLYWSVYGSTIVFASELKAMNKHPLCKRDISLPALNKYLASEYIPTPNTIFQDIYKLEPASILVWQKGKIRRDVFWKINTTKSIISLEQAIQQLDSHIDQSVRDRLISDVPLGIFLSGGIDSSTIAYYAQKNSATPIQTFSIGFSEKSFDESDSAEKVSDWLGTNHHQKMLRPQDLIDRIQELEDVLDEPVADASIVPTLLLSEFTREQVTVALGGDGGDELFAGYPTFQAGKVANYYDKLPNVLRKHVFERMINYLPISEKNFGTKFKLKKFVEGDADGGRYRDQVWLGSFGNRQRKELFRKDVWEEIKNNNAYEEVDKYAKEAELMSHHNQLLYVYLRTYLMDDVLVKVDRASMYNSLEVRAPFLDHRLVDFVYSLPYDMKLNGFTTKFILKKLMKDKLPSGIVSRPKKGFGIPLTKWLRHELNDFCNDILSADTIQKSGYFSVECVEKLKREHFSGKEDNRKLLWTLMTFQLWHNKWCN